MMELTVEMTELTAEILLRKADELLADQGNARDVIHLCQAAAVLYQSVGQLNLTIAALMKIGVGLQDNIDFYQEVVEAYKGAASIYEHEGNKEACSTVLMSAAFVAQKAQSVSLANNLFLKAGEGYQNVADTYWNQKKYELAWDNMQLAYRCLQSILINTSTLE